MSFSTNIQIEQVEKNVSAIPVVRISIRLRERVRKNGSVILDKKVYFLSHVWVGLRYKG